MENGLFRQESIDQVSSPEQIRDYLRVTSPRLWMLIVAVAVLAVGFFVYSTQAGQEITAPVKVEVRNISVDGKEVSTMYFLIPHEEKDQYQAGMTVRFAGITGQICFFVDTEELTEASVMPDKPDTVLPEGQYDAVVVVEKSTPISELLN